MTEKKQVQRRMKRLIVPCDKLSKLPFTFTAEEYIDIINNRTKLGCVEDPDDPDSPITPYWIEQAADCTDMKPLDPFHREVLFVCISAYAQGFNYVTFSMTLDALTGGDKSRIYSEQMKAIESAVRKMMKTTITVDLDPLFEAKPKYQKNYVGSAHLTGYLLPCHIVDVELNGQKTFAIELIAESPLMTVAKAKKQLVTYGTAPLAVAEQNNTPQVMTIKNWLLRRIMLIEKRGLNSSILFDSLYKECGIKDASRSTKQNARKVIFDTLDAFRTKGVIKSYDVERERNKYRALKILL